MINECSWCNEAIHPEDSKSMPDDLPDDLPYKDDVMLYHRWCFEDVVHEYRSEIAAKHGDG